MDELQIALLSKAQLERKLSAISRGEPFFRLLSGRIEKATQQSAAFDLFADCNVLLSDVIEAVPTGVRTEFSPGFVCIIKEKSGLALKGIEIKAGVIDADYRQEWKVLMRNREKECFHITAGMKIAQVVILKVADLIMLCEDDAEVIFKDVPRKGGFGSTGK